MPRRPRLPAPGDPRTLDAFKDGHLLVAESTCDECLFSRNKLVSEHRKKELLKECYVKGTYFICHKATLAGRAVVCHNFAKSTDGAGNVAIRVAQFFNAIRFVNPASGKPSKSARGLGRRRGMSSEVLKAFGLGSGRR